MNLFVRNIGICKNLSWGKRNSTVCIFQVLLISRTWLNVQCMTLILDSHIYWTALSSHLWKNSIWGTIGRLNRPMDRTFWFSIIIFFIFKYFKFFVSNISYLLHCWGWIRPIIWVNPFCFFYFLLLQVHFSIHNWRLAKSMWKGDHCMNMVLKMSHV